MAGFAETNPLAGFASGYQVGAGIRADQLAQQQQQLALQQQRQQQEVLRTLYANPNPTADDYSRASLMLPQLREQLKQSWEIKNADQQQSWLRDTGQVFYALNNDRPDIAAKLLNDRAAAMKSAGVNPREIAAMQQQAQMVQQDPVFARGYAGMLLASAPGGDKVITNYGNLGQEQRAAAKAPAELAKLNADAGIATANAATQPERNALDLRNLAEDAETKAQQRQINALDVQIRQANSETQRGELVLQRDKLTAELQQKQEAKTQAAQSQLEGIDRSLDTVKSIMQSPAIDGWFTGAGTFAGAHLGLLPGTERRTLQGLVDTLTSQQFLTSIKDMQGMGALSDAEGARISAAVAKLDLNMKPQAFRNAVGVVQAALEKARNKLVASGNLPASGGGFVMKTPAYGNVTEGDINRLLRQYPGSTREQVMQFLQQSGAPQAPRVGQ